jgi:hypothetical protein
MDCIFLGSISIDSIKMAGICLFFLVCFIVVDVPMKKNRKVVQLTIFTNQIERIVKGVSAGTQHRKGG